MKLGDREQACRALCLCDDVEKTRCRGEQPCTHLHGVARSYNKQLDRRRRVRD
jgi:hypothetical protein